VDEDSRAVDVIGIVTGGVELLTATIEEAGRIFVIDVDALVAGFSPNSIVGTSLVLAVPCVYDTYQLNVLVAVIVVDTPIGYQIFFLNLG